MENFDLASDPLGSDFELLGLDQGWVACARPGGSAVACTAPAGSLAACPGPATPDIELIQDASGLLFRDQFARADSGTVGNGWDDSAGLKFEILDQRLRLVTNVVETQFVSRPMPAGTDWIVQRNFRASYDNAQQRLLMRAGTTDIWVYHKEFLFEGRRWRLHKGGQNLVDSDESAPLNQWHLMRLVSESATKQLRVYRALGLASGTVLTVDPTLLMTGTYADAVLDVDTARILETQDFGSVQMFQDCDEFLVCGRNIVVSGLPTGWKVQVDGRAAVTEVGGSVTLDVDTWALPATTVRLLDSANQERAVLTPADGVWGGDRYSLTEPIWDGCAAHAGAVAACTAMGGSVAPC